MKSTSIAAALGALAFGILTFVAFMLANPPGGGYSAHDAANYVTSGHRPVVFVSMYLILVTGIGLLLLLARLREAILGGRSRVFWGLGVAAVSAWIVGYALVVATPASYAFGGASNLHLTNDVIYVLSESGWAIMYGAGGTLLGCALLTFALGPVTAPAWVRWSTLVAGIAAIAGIAWFPFFLVYIWAIVLGLWLLVADRGRAAAPAVQAALRGTGRPGTAAGLPVDSAKAGACNGLPCRSSAAPIASS
jgi:hypothetical protein